MEPKESEEMPASLKEAVFTINADFLQSMDVVKTSGSPERIIPLFMIGLFVNNLLHQYANYLQKYADLIDDKDLKTLLKGDEKYTVKVVKLDYATFLDEIRRKNGIPALFTTLVNAKNPKCEDAVLELLNNFQFSFADIIAWTQFLKKMDDLYSDTLQKVVAMETNPIIRLIRDLSK